MSRSQIQGFIWYRIDEQRRKCILPMEPSALGHF